MQNDVLRIFVPEWVPVSNKGEEAIVLGYADTLFPGRKVIPVVLDMTADEYYEQDGIEVYPGKYFYPKWENREFGLAWSWFRLESSFLSLFRHLLDKILPSWILRKTPQLRKLEKTILRFRSGAVARNQYEKHMYKILSCDYIIAGHDGGLDIRVCQVLDVLKANGFPYGIYGSSLCPKMRDPIRIGIFDHALGGADYIYVRNPAALQWATSYLPQSGKNVKLCPDPAFGMNPAPPPELEREMDRNHAVKYMKHPVIVMTVCEPVPIARHSFSAILSPEQKKLAHRKLLKDLTEHILDTTEANIVFLPHSIGPEAALDDRIVAKSVISMIPENKRAGRVHLLQNELNGRVLKGFIGTADLLIGERIHSIIGSVKVNTPFLCIGSNADFRIHGIVETMLQAKPYRYLLDYPKAEELNSLFDHIWSSLPAIRDEREVVNRSVLAMLDNAAVDIKAKMKHL